uniref:Uncharacterized protein n=1 Tax=viral metagenome TaxID=1070528 RepID=A0A6C0HTJ8_9ZZZZ
MGNYNSSEEPIEPESTVKKTVKRRKRTSGKSLKNKKKTYFNDNFTERPYSEFI